MARPSAFARGFRSARQEPAVILAEIAWRWLCGGIAILLAAWAAVVVLRSIEVSKADQFLLRTLNPAILQYVLRDLFHNKTFALLREAFVLAVCLSLLWVLVATVGRSAVTRILLERSDLNAGRECSYDANLRAVAAIQTMRVALLWIGAAAYVLAALIASWLSTSDGQTQPAMYAVLFLFLFGIAAVVLSFFNWILLLAPIFAIRGSQTSASAIRSALRFTRTRAGALAGLNLAHLALRLIWFVFMSGIAMLPLGFLQVLPKALVWFAVLATTLLYCAVADALFLARYAGYIEIATQEMADVPAASELVTANYEGTDSRPSPQDLHPDSRS